MRTVASLLIFLLSGAVVRAQDQERKLVDRILSPNTTLANPLQGKSFYDGKTFVSTNQANVREFYFPQRYDSKQFTTKDFRSTSFWQGDFHFATKDAQTKKDTRDEKEYATKAAEVKDARESSKLYETRDYANAREFRAQGKSQKMLDAERARKEMSIDQVRELLNKNK